MKSTSSALTPRKIAEFCKSRFTTIFTEGEVRLLHSCLVDLLERAEYPPYRGSGLDLHFNLNLAGVLELQGQREAFARHQGFLQTKQHHVVAARSKHGLTASRNTHRVELLHFHHVAQLHHGVDFCLGGLRCLHTD